MKIAAMQYSSGLRARLGVLVGAVTMGTAFPWLVRGVSDEKCLPLEVTLGTVSALATLRALCSCFFATNSTNFQSTVTKALGTEENDVGSQKIVPVSLETSVTKKNWEGEVIQNATYIGNSASSNGQPDRQNEILSGVAALKAMIKSSEFCAAAIGYFGHMWESFAYWAIHSQFDK
jgi:hypothetical protein